MEERKKGSVGKVVDSFYPWIQSDFPRVGCDIRTRFVAGWREQVSGMDSGRDGVMTGLANRLVPNTLHALHTSVSHSLCAEYTNLLTKQQPGNTWIPKYVRMYLQDRVPPLLVASKVQFYRSH